jgi:hypothetical protein
MIFKRIMATLSTTNAYKCILITDPAIVKSPAQFSCFLKNSGVAVRFKITSSLYKNLNNFDTEDDEESFTFGKCIGSAKLLGQHVSDSGLTCITDDPPYPTTTEKKSNEELEDFGFDWTEFVMTTLSNPEVTSDPESFPILKWFSRVPAGGSSAVIYGYSPVKVNEKGDLAYEGFKIKAM